MAGGVQAPPTVSDDDLGVVPPVTPDTVRPGLKERVMGGLGNVATAAAGGDPNAASPLKTAIDKHHQQQAVEADMHQRNLATYFQGHLMVRQGINPETGMRFDDPNYPGGAAKAQYDQQQMDHNYTQMYLSSKQHYLKAAGLNKELKDAITKQGNLMDYVSDAVTKQGAAKGGVQPPPGSGGSPAAPGTTTTPTSGIAAPAVNDEGNPGGGAGSGVTPPPKPPDSGPAAASTPTTPESPFPAGGYGLTPAMLKRAQAIEDERREDKRNLENFKAQHKVLHDYKMTELDEAAKARAANPTGRATPLKPISVEKARELAKGGGTFAAADPTMADDNGNLNLENLPDDMMLVPLQQNGRIVGYGIAEQGQKRLVFNNQVVVVPEFQQTEAAEKGKVQGTARVGTTSTSSEPGVDSEGNAAILHKSRTSTPVTGGGGVTSPGGSAAPSSATPKTPAGGGTASPTAFPPPKKGGTGGGNVVYSPSQYNQFRKIATPLREANVQLFGDPDNPSYDSLESYADIADDPKEREALAKAVHRSIGGIEQKMNDTKGIVDLIKNETGFTNQLIQSQIDADTQAIATLSPRNQQAYARIMSALGGMIGARAATGASAARFSALALERELPIPGINSFSSAQFNKQLNGIAGEILTGAKGVPIMHGKELDALKANVARTGIKSNGKSSGDGAKVVQWERKKDGTLGPK